MFSTESTHIFLGVEEINKTSLVHFAKYDSEVYPIPKTPLSRCLKIVPRLNNSTATFLTGYHDSDENFYVCPISIFYCLIETFTINEIKTEAENEWGIKKTNITYSLNFKLKLFSKNFIEYKNFEYTSRLGYKSYYSLILDEIISIINILNNIVDFDYNLDFLPEHHINGDKFLKEYSESDLFIQINNLGFSFFTNDKSIPRKENRYWKEIEITNLPNSLYIQKLYYTILRDNKVFNVSHSDNLLILSYDHDSYYSPTMGRQESYIENSLVEKVKDILRIGILKNFNARIEITERFIEIFKK
jgi:hypothetical protein